MRWTSGLLRGRGARSMGHVENRMVSEVNEAGSLVYIGDGRKGDSLGKNKECNGMRLYVRNSG